MMHHTLSRVVGPRLEFDTPTQQIIKRPDLIKSAGQRVTLQSFTDIEPVNGAPPPKKRKGEPRCLRELCRSLGTLLLH